MTADLARVTAISRARSPRRVLAAPFTGWVASWHAFDYGATSTAFVLRRPGRGPGRAVPGVGALGRRIYRMDTGLAGLTATAPVVFDERQWRRQAKAARARSKAPGLSPLTDRQGPDRRRARTIRSVGHAGSPVLAIPWTAMGRHQVIVGSSGSGKTNLMIRTWAGWYTAARHAARAPGAPRPLLVVLDCKGGPDARSKAARTARCSAPPAPGRVDGVAGRRVGVAVDAAAHASWRSRCSSSSTPPTPARPRSTPTSPRPSSSWPSPRPAARPPTPPSSWTGSTRPGSNAPTRPTGPGLAAVRAAAKHLPDISLRYRTLLDRLGPAFDGTATLADADAWYFILEGTREQSVAQAQALAITELLAHAATDMDAEPRAVLLACDDYSAVSGKVPLWQLYERGRSLGIGVQVSAQSWQGLGATMTSGTGSPPPPTAGSG